MEIDGDENDNFFGVLSDVGVMKMGLMLMNEGLINHEVAGNWVKPELGARPHRQPN